MRAQRSGQRARPTERLQQALAPSPRLVLGVGGWGAFLVEAEVVFFLLLGVVADALRGLYSVCGVCFAAELFA